MKKSQCNVTAAHRARVIVLHETAGWTYFEALRRLKRAGEIDSLEFRESQVVRLLLSNVRQKERSLASCLAQTFRNLVFRVFVPFVKDRIVILGMAPWNVRLVWYRLLASRNKVLYHTSWVDWHHGRVPRQYGPLTLPLRRVWLGFLKHPNVSIVAVSPASAESVESFSGRPAIVIPHTISPEFFLNRADVDHRPFGVLFVGRLLTHKGIGLFPRIIERLPGHAVLGIVGTGPCHGFVKRLAMRNVRVSHYGAIYDRAKLARLVSQHHVLVVPSQRTPGWEELFGMVILEAMAAGLVVVASDHVGPRSIITDRKDGFIVREGDVEAFSARIDELFYDQAKWTEMSQNAHKTAARYDIERVSAAWQRLI